LLAFRDSVASGPRNSRSRYFGWIKQAGSVLKFSSDPQPPAIRKLPNCGFRTPKLPRDP
jgi:hypothetical protein